MFLIFNLYVHSGEHLQIIHWVWPRKTFFKCDIYQVCINYTLITLSVVLLRGHKKLSFYSQISFVTGKRSDQWQQRKGMHWKVSRDLRYRPGQKKKKCILSSGFESSAKDHGTKFCLCWRSLCWASHVGIFYLCHQPWIFYFPHSKTPCKAYTNHKFYY